MESKTRGPDISRRLSPSTGCSIAGGKALIASAASRRLERWSPVEWKARVDLAACYRLISQFRMADPVPTHLSARVPGTEHFLLDASGLPPQEITASNLMKIDLRHAVEEEIARLANAACFSVPSAIYRARADVHCLLHTQTPAGMAVSCLGEGLLPLSQLALQFYDRLAYHECESMDLDMNEGDRIARDLGGGKAMILRSNGLLTAGATVPEAFTLMFYLERACQTQLAALSTGRELIAPVPEVCAKVGRQFDRPRGTREWRALVRQLDRTDPSYRE
jgi:ribulose-5-phosphate 4-epimerase/fuculose-1-phosphate aldolase